MGMDLREFTSVQMSLAVPWHWDSSRSIDEPTVRT
jgi:hypothetical protein